MKKKILLIDDDDLVTQTARNLLNRSGYETTVVNSGQDALGLISKNDFDLILCDIRMPGKNGVETVQEIQALLKTKNKPSIPSFFFTGYAEDQAFAEAQSMGEVLLKPYDIHELLRLVERHIK